MKALQALNNGSPFLFNTWFGDFDRVFDGVGTPMVRHSKDHGADHRRGFLPAYEIAEGDKDYLLSFDVPGIPKENIFVEIKDRCLRVFGERKESKPDASESASAKECRFSEFRYGSFERTFTLPTDVDIEKIEAQNRDGVLSLKLPKMEKSQAKNIKIS